MQTKRLETLEQVRGFVEGNAGVDFELTERKSGCEFIRRTLVRFGYHGLGKADKGTVKAYLGKVTGLSSRIIPLSGEGVMWACSAAHFCEHFVV